MKNPSNKIAAILLMMLFPLLLWKGSAAAEGVCHGLALSYRSVLPSLLPAMLLCGILAELIDCLPLPAGISIWLLAQLCGFPSGIRLTARCYQNGYFPRRAAVALSLCCANASPAFLILYIGGLIGNRRDGLILFGSQVAISFLIGAAFRVFDIKASDRPEKRSLMQSISKGFAGSIWGAAVLIGYITAFSALASLLKQLPFFSFLYPFLELCGGTACAPSRPYLLAAASGFGGCAVMLQNCGILAEANLPLFPMLCAKLGYAAVLPFCLWLGKEFGLEGLIIFFLFCVFLISFDKWRKRRYNNNDINMNTRKQHGGCYDLFQRD